MNMKHLDLEGSSYRCSIAGHDIYPDIRVACHTDVSPVFGAATCKYSHSLSLCHAAASASRCCSPVSGCTATMDGATDPSAGLQAMISRPCSVTAASSVGAGAMGVCSAWPCTQEQGIDAQHSVRD